MITNPDHKLLGARKSISNIEHRSAYLQYNNSKKNPFGNGPVVI